MELPTCNCYQHRWIPVKWNLPKPLLDAAFTIGSEVWKIIGQEPSIPIHDYEYGVTVSFLPTSCNDRSAAGMVVNVFEGRCPPVFVVNLHRDPMRVELRFDRLRAGMDQYQPVPERVQQQARDIANWLTGWAQRQQEVTNRWLEAAERGRERREAAAALTPPASPVKREDDVDVKPVKKEEEEETSVADTRTEQDVKTDLVSANAVRREVTPVQDRQSTSLPPTPPRTPLRRRSSTSNEESSPTKRIKREPSTSPQLSEAPLTPAPRSLQRHIRSFPINFALVTPPATPAVKTEEA